MHNIQPIEKQNLDSSERLSVHSIFRTIQGEGPFCGIPAVFIRLAGCNLQCPACDTDYTSGRHTMFIKEIVAKVKELENRSSVSRSLVVISGGEPFRQNLRQLVEKLLSDGFFVQIETNGTLHPTFDTRHCNIDTYEEYGVYIVCSPKTGIVDQLVEQYACAFKYVVEEESISPVDGLPIKALKHSVKTMVARPGESFRGTIYIQPMDSKNIAQNHRNVQTALASSMEFGYTLQLQVHKILGVE